MPIKISLEFTTVAEAVAALLKLDGAGSASAPLPCIEVSGPPGSTDEPPANDTVVMDPVAVFGGAAAPVVPPLAPSTAAAEASPTAPVAPPADTVAATVAAAPPAPNPVSTAPVPSAPAATANPAVADSSGLPWDARIHAGNKATNKDGTWRQKRGLDDDAFKAKIEAELRAIPGIVAAPVAPPAALEPVATTPVAPPVAAPAPAGITFAQLMARLAPHFATNAGVMTGHMSTALAQVGLQNPGQLGAAPHLVEAVSNILDSLMATPA